MRAERRTAVGRPLLRCPGGTRPEIWARCDRIEDAIGDLPPTPSELDYPLHDWAATVTHCGRICFKGRKVNLSRVFAGQQVGVRQVTERVWLVTFMRYDLGIFDDETCRLEPIENPFGPTVLPSLRNNPSPM